MKQSIDCFKTQDEFIRQFLQALDCPRALTVLILYETGEHDQLVNLEFHPNDYNSLPSADSALQATKFLSKAKFLDVKLDKRAIAIDKFLDCEQQCSVVNSRIYNSLYSDRAATILSIAQRKIAYILGAFSAEEFAESADWGPGATTAIPRRNACKPIKYSLETGITSAAYDFVTPWFLSAYPVLGHVKFDRSRGISKIVTVPKNAKTDRIIAIEPGWNLFFQKSIGKMIRRRLKRIGIDLNDQRINAKKARLASMSNDMATVDFSSASDTISLALVRFLLELAPRWLSLFEAFRTSTAILDDRVLVNNKFSSMGNGFTFELESLIFYTISLAICEVNGVDTSGVSIYGDDLLLPSSVFDEARSIFAELGFTINRQKSFSSGYYRESCGSHYWNGHNIKPIFLKEPLSARQVIYKTANSVRRLAHRHSSFGCDARFRSCWQLLARVLGDCKCLIPEGFGDGGLVVCDDELPVFQRPKNGMEGFFVPMLVARPSRYNYDEVGLLYSCIREIKGSYDPTGIDYISSYEVNLPSEGKIVLPMRTKDKKVKVLVPRWVDIGAWC